MHETANEDKQAKREARQLFEQARVLAEVGDYRSLRALDRRIVALAPTSDVGRQAAAELESLKLDRAGILVGVLALCLWLVAWLTSLA